MTTRLSSPIEQLKNHYQVVVVGSGYGGAIAASRLARSGRQVCLLERGREIQPGEYPDTEMEALEEIQITHPSRPPFRIGALATIAIATGTIPATAASNRPRRVQRQMTRRVQRPPCAGQPLIPFFAAVKLSITGGLDGLATAEQHFRKALIPKGVLGGKRHQRAGAKPRSQ